MSDFNEQDYSWADSLERTKEESLIEGLQTALPELQVDPITGEIRKPEDCEGCSA